GEKESGIDCTTTFGSGKFKVEYRIDELPSGSLLNEGELVGTGSADDKGMWKQFEHEFDGRTRVGITIPAGGKSRLKLLAFQPGGAKPLFDGKTLDGWKVIPDHKSKFSVTPEGCINVKNGNGDLQTTDQWDDFVFQIEI